MVQGTSAWAVNLETEPSDFDFEIVLGGFHGDREGGSYVHAVGEPATCHVFIQRSIDADDSGFRQLEIHSPLTDDDVDRDRVEYELAEQCREQFAFAVSLYGPTPLIMVPWEHRVRSGGRHAVITLHGERLTHFLTFARRLLEFQADRIHFVHAWLRTALSSSTGDRYDDPDILGMDARSADPSFLKRRAHVLFAAHLFEAALRHQRGRLGLFRQELRLVLLSAAAEALFTNDNTEVAHKMALRMAALNGQGAGEQSRIFKLVKHCYGLRSQYVHGTVYRDKKLLMASQREMDRFAGLIRASLLYGIALSRRQKDDVLEDLDAALFSGEKLSELRREANGFWGLGDSDAERLHAAAWMN